MKIGLVFAPLNNFKGLADTIYSAKSHRDLQVYIEPQYRRQVALSKAWNDGAQRAFDDGCEFAIVCNDDILFAPQTIDALVDQYEILRESDNVIMTTPNNILMQLANPDDIFNYQMPPGDPTWSEHPNFSCFCIKQEFFELHGKFDENFNPAWFEDNDSHYRAKLLGYKEVCTTAAPQVHFGGVSTSMIKDNPGAAASEAYYIKKWGSVNRTGEEAYKTPYNDPTLTPKDWRPE